MKNLFRYTFLTAVCAVSACSVASCSDETDAEKDKGAVPVIKYARSCDINSADSLIVSAPLGAKLAFVGDNLGDVQQVWFNDQKARLNPNMVTSHSIIVDVPNVIPAEVNNKARFITSDGTEVAYDFNVSVPAPRVSGMSCEYAPAGEIVTITGSYFADDPNVPLTVTFGEVPATIKSITQDAIEVEVPQGATEAPIVVTSIYGEGESTFHYLDTQGMLFDFDGLTGLGTEQSWHKRPVITDETSISGNYITIGDGSTLLAGKDAWDDSNFSFEYWAGAWTDPVTYPARVGERLFDIVDFSDFNNMSLKFELNIPSASPWQACSMQLIFSGTDRVSFGAAGVDEFGNTVPGCNNTYFQEGGWARGLWTPWTASEPYHTDGKWITVSFPIKDFAYDKDGTGAAKFLSAPTDFANLQIFLWNGGVEGVDCTPLLKIDNIRVVKN